MELKHLAAIGVARFGIILTGSTPHNASSERKKAAESVRHRSDIEAIVDCIVEKVLKGKLDIEEWALAKHWRAAEPHRFPNDPPVSSAELARQLIGRAPYPKRRLAEFLYDRRLQIEDVMPPSVFQPTVFNVFGCPCSVDIDIVALAPSMEIVEKVQSGEIKIDASAIRTQLNELGYEPSRALDLRIVAVQERGEVEMCAGAPGNKRIQNMVFETFHLHSQRHECLFAHLAELDLLEQLRSVGKIVLDNSRVLVGGSIVATAGREQRAALLGCGSGGKGDAWRRLECAIDVMDEWVFDSHRADVFKQICMKLIQIALLTCGLETYTKYDMLAKASNMFTYEEGLRYLLFLGEEGHACQVADALQELRATYVNALNTCRTAITWTIAQLSDQLNNPTELPDDVFFAILRSPLIIPLEFRKWFYEVHLSPGEVPYLPNFVLKSSPAHVIPGWLRSRVEFADQRSDEWLQLYSFYTCGRHTGVPVCTDRDQFLYDYYHLVRGCVMEMVLMYSLDYKALLNMPNVTSASVGFIVEKKGQHGAQGAAPDLLLIIPGEKSGDDHVLPVEMKTMNESFAENANYRREVKLATWQLRSACDLIGRGRCGLLMMAWWDNSQWELHHTFINVDTGRSISDPSCVS